MKVKILREANTIKLQDIGRSGSSESSALSTFKSSGNKSDADEKDQWIHEPYIDPLDHLRRLGFENIEFLGEGMFGKVYGAEFKGRELAIKIVSRAGPGADRELNAYQEINDARKDSDLIAKHFPLVYKTTHSTDHYYIIMEKLTDKGAYAKVIDDLFSGSEYQLGPRDDMMMKGAWKDLSNRMFMYFSKDAARNKIIDNMLSGMATEDFEKEVKSWADGWHGWVNNNEGLKVVVYELIDKLGVRSASDQYEDTFLDEFGNLKRKYEEAVWLAYFPLGVISMMEKFEPDKNDPEWLQVSQGGYKENWISQAGSGVIGWFADFINKSAPIGIHHKPGWKKADRGGAGAEIGDVYEEAKSIRAALDELEAKTGLAARDMHDKNVMMRPSTGDIVIVDVGMFKLRSEIKENKKNSNKKTLKCSIRRKK